MCVEESKTTNLWFFKVSLKCEMQSLISQCFNYQFHLTSFKNKILDAQIIIVFFYVSQEWNSRSKKLLQVTSYNLVVRKLVCFICFVMAAFKAKQDEIRRLMKERRENLKDEKNRIESPFAKYPFLKKVKSAKYYYYMFVLYICVRKVLNFNP